MAHLKGSSEAAQELNDTLVRIIQQLCASVTTQYQNLRQLAQSCRDDSYSEMERILRKVAVRLQQVMPQLAVVSRRLSAYCELIDSLDRQESGGHMLETLGIDAKTKCQWLQNYKNTILQSAVPNEKGLLTPQQEAARWKGSVRFVNEMISNYCDELKKRGIPECSWLEQTLNREKVKMLKYEGEELRFIQGERGELSDDEIYRYPICGVEYPYNVYDQLVDQFYTHCLTSTNPNYRPETCWDINCQRCVPTYEQLRRGRNVTAKPAPGGNYDHLSSHPFDAWINPTIITGYADGMADIQAQMQAWGNGARAQVVVMWTEQAGHTFIAEQRGSRTIFLDPQTGKMDCYDYFDCAMHGKTRFCRIDNLQPSGFITDCYTEVTQ